MARAIFAELNTSELRLMLPRNTIPHMKKATEATVMRCGKGLMCILSLGLSACTTVGPDYQEPTMAAPPQWQTPMPHSGKEASLEGWWQQFDDPTLVSLVKAAAADSPSLDKAWASIESARANLASVRSRLAPSVDGSASVTSSRQQGESVDVQPGSGGDISTSRSAGFDASWELDLFGKVQRSSEEAQARLQARVGEWNEARVSLAAEVADTYVQYRGCRLLVGAYEQELASMEKTAGITTASVRAGFTAPADGSLSRASLASTQSSLQAQRVECDQLIKALVALTGLQEADLRSQLVGATSELPKPTAFRIEAVPADVLRQRPDVAALERKLAAANAAIGAAQADRYPSVSLSGSISISATNSSASSGTWSFGPSLSIPLFDGGRRRAAVDSANADYQSALAEWRQGVRNAVKEIEQALVNLNGAAFRTEQAELATREYRTYFEATKDKWRAGSESLLNLESARRSALSAEVEYLSLLRSQVQYWIALYKAVGGGWAPSDSATPVVSLRGSQVSQGGRS